MLLFCFVYYVTKIDVDETDKTDNSLFVTVSSQTSNCHLKYFKVNKLFKNTSITFLFAKKSAGNSGDLPLTPSSSCCKILSNSRFIIPSPLSDAHGSASDFNGIRALNLRCNGRHNKF